MAFIDFAKAFDTVNRQKLWSVLRKLGVKGRLLCTIKAMYHNVKVKVNCGNQKYTDYIRCPLGLKQGCLASAVLFTLFIDELYKLLEGSDVRGIQIQPDLVQMFLLMYADDIALISDTVIGLQRELIYCLIFVTPMS